MCVLQMAFASFPYWVQLPTPTLQHVYRSINGNLKTGHLHSVCGGVCLGWGQGTRRPKYIYWTWSKERESLSVGNGQSLLFPHLLTVFVKIPTNIRI